MTARLVAVLVAAILLAAILLAAGCSSDSNDGGVATVAPDDPGVATSDSAGVRVVSPEEAAVIQSDPPADLVILDVRTPEEFAEGHLEGAVMLDFYEPDFADQLAELDPDVPYLLYCRSGNRSGQTRALMTELGFHDVADVEGGIVNWADSGLPVVSS